MKQRVRSNWRHALLVCAKCSKKLDGGFGPKQQKLAKALRRELQAKKGRKSHTGVVEVPCLDVCPKGGVVVVDTRCLNVWRIVRPEAKLAQIVEEIQRHCATAQADQA